MTYRRVPFVSGEYFHIYNRGNSKQKIFLDDEDRDRFVKLLFIHNSRKNVKFRDDIIKPKISAWDFDRGDNLVSVGAWVLMPNHFHLYLTSPRPGRGLEDEAIVENNSFSKYMSKICASYSMYFNKKYGRTGSLFEGRFKAVHIKNEIQAKYLFSYIHLNPIKLIQLDWKEIGIKDEKEVLKYLSKYKWGSYLDYKGIKRKENLILDRVNFINYFPEVADFDKEILECIREDDGLTN